MSQTKYVTEVSEFYEILLDNKLDNKNFPIHKRQYGPNDLQFQGPNCQQFKKYKHINRILHHKPC